MHVSAEDFVSGPGLENIYRLQTGTELAAPEIGKAAMAGDGPAREAAMTMLGILGTVIADAVLTTGSWRGVVIAGGIVAQLQPLLADSPFAERFRHGGTMGRLLADVPVWLSVDPHAGLRGAAVAMATVASGAGDHGWLILLVRAPALATKRGMARLATPRRKAMPAMARMVASSPRKWPSTPNSAGPLIRPK